MTNKVVHDRLSEHFTAAEFACHCRSAKCIAPKVPMPELVAKLEELRALWGRKIWIISGNRCPEHNKKIGGAGGSEHLWGRAADLKVENANEARALAALAERVGFKGIGVGKRRLHVDVRSGKRARWEYNDDGTMA